MPFLVRARPRERPRPAVSDLLRQTLPGLRLQGDELTPEQLVFEARGLAAIGEHSKAYAIMLRLYTRYRRGEIEMREEWLDLFEKMNALEGTSVG